MDGVYLYEFWESGKGGILGENALNYCPIIRFLLTAKNFTSNTGSLDCEAMATRNGATFECQ